MKLCEGVESLFTCLCAQVFAFACFFSSVHSVEFFFRCENKGKIVGLVVVLSFHGIYLSAFWQIGACQQRCMIHVVGQLLDIYFRKSILFAYHLNLTKREQERHLSLISIKRKKAHKRMGALSTHTLTQFFNVPKCYWLVNLCFYEPLILVIILSILFIEPFMRAGNIRSITLRPCHLACHGMIKKKRKKKVKLKIETKSTPQNSMQKLPITFNFVVIKSSRKKNETDGTEWADSPGDYWLRCNRTEYFFQ